MEPLHKSLGCIVASFLACTLLAGPARAQTEDNLHLPPTAIEGNRLLYDGDPDAAIELFRKIQQEQPEDPLGYLLEANARWWKIYCATLEIKYNTIDAWPRAKLAEDDAFFALADKVVTLAEAQIKQSDSGEMRLYAGMGWLERGRLHGLRDERRATARAGVRAREHLLRAIELDPSLADAYTGLGLYNYYVDTLSAIAKVLRFFMGIPGGDKRDGIRQLERGMTRGELTPVEARFYLAKNLRNYDRQYERAAEVLAPLVIQYPHNPLFALLLGDMNAKLNRKEKASGVYGAAAELTVHDATCRARIQQVVREATAALKTPTKGGS